MSTSSYNNTRLRYSNDHVFVKSLVVILLVLETLQISWYFDGTYYYFVEQFGNFQAFTYSPWFVYYLCSWWSYILTLLQGKLRPAIGCLFVRLRRTGLLRGHSVAP